MLFPNHYLPTLILALPLSITVAQAAVIYVSSYAGNVTALFLTGHHPSKTSASPNSQGPYKIPGPSGPLNYTIRPVSRVACANDPSWLAMDSELHYLYCIGEGLNGIKGGLTVFQASEFGDLQQLSTEDTAPGSVNGVVHGAPMAAGQRLSVANYSGSVNTYNLTSHGTPTTGDSITPPSLLQNLNFTLAHPGSDPIRQGKSHPHQAVLDPTHEYVLSPDLGADLVRVFRIQLGTGTLQPCENLQVKPGTGARHMAFWRGPANCTTSSGNGRRHVQGGKFGAASRPQRVMKRAEEAGRRQPEQGVKRAEEEEGQLFMYLVGELGNTITTFAVSYPAAGGMAFTELGSTDTFGGKGVPAGAAAAEIAVSGNHLVVSNRNDTSFLANSSSPSSGRSDSLATFAIGHNGTLTFSALSPAGGSYPRSFSINRAGNLVAVGLQLSGKVVVIERDVKTGKMGDIVTWYGGLGNVTCVVWDER